MNESCAAAPVSTASDPDPVRTDVDGRFPGRFETLASSPISVACTIVRALNEDGAVVAETLVSLPRDEASLDEACKIYMLKGYMEKGFTEDPDVALSGLISIALLGVLVIGGGLVASGLNDQSWIRIVGGAVLWGGLSWMVWQAGQVVRRNLRDVLGKGASGG